MAKKMIPIAGAVWICCALSGCQTPFEPVEADELLRQSIDTAIGRELKSFSVQESAEMRALTQAPGLVEQALASRRDELDAIGPDTTDSDREMQLGLDLTGHEQMRVEISLSEAIHSAVEHNLDIQAARLQPAISAQDVISAEAVFDALLFGSVDFAKIDQPSRVPVVMGVPVGTGNNANEQYRFETGVQKLTRSGATLWLSTDLARDQNNASGISQSVIVSSCQANTRSQ